MKFTPTSFIPVFICAEAVSEEDPEACYVAQISFKQKSQLLVGGI